MYPQPEYPQIDRNRPMTNELTLREKAEHAIQSCMVNDDGNGTVCALNAIAALLEDTGSPAHMRVAKELRRE